MRHLFYCVAVLGLTVITPAAVPQKRHRQGRGRVSCTSASVLLSF
jgi:hypothetical protein